jgi:phasin family protein
MYSAQEQFAALNKTQLETATRFASVALGGAERLLEIQLKTAKETLADSVEGVKTLTAVKDLQQFSEIKDSVAQPAFEKATAYMKSMYEVASETQAEFTKLIEQQFAGMNKQFVVALDKFAESAPAGSEAGISALKQALATGTAAYENITKVTKQFSDTAKSTIETAAKRAAPAAKKAKK